MSMIPIQQSLAAWGGYDDDVRKAEKVTYFRQTRHYLHAFWPKECKNAGDTSGIACMMVLARHMNHGITHYKETIPDKEGPGLRRRWEEKANPLLRLSWKVAPLQKSEQYEMLKKEMVQVDGNYEHHYSFEFWNNSELMRKTLWDRPEYHLFGSIIAKEDDTEWNASKSLRSHVIEIDNAKTGKNGFDVSAAIREIFNSFLLEESEAGEKFDSACPDIISVRYTPSALDYKHLDALHSFNIELPFSLESSKRQKFKQYNLTAAVRLRGSGLHEEDKRDRIRLFTEGGIDIYPEDPCPYADMKWDLAEYGHSYYLYYSRTRAWRMPPLTDLERESRDSCDESRRSDEYLDIFKIMSRKEDGDKTASLLDIVKPELQRNLPQERLVLDMSQFNPYPRSADCQATPSQVVNEDDVEIKDTSVFAGPAPALP